MFRYNPTNSFHILATSLVFLYACSSDRLTAPVRLPSRSDLSIGVKPAVAPCTRFMTWREGSAFDGRLVTNQLIADGDAACSAGETEGASKLYDQAAKLPAAPRDQRELAIRRAALALGKGAASDALLILGALTKHADDAQINLPDFGFLTAAAYAGTGDIDQAIAWWSKVYVAASGTSFALRSRDAIFETLRRADDETLERVQANWRDDDMVRTQLAQARANRLAPGQSGQAGQDFANGQGSQVQFGSNVSALPVTGDSIGLLLPLSGRFQALGERAKRGVEVALSVQATPATLITVDSGESATLVRSKLNELLTSGAQIIIGPLLAEQVEDVAVSAPSNSVVLSLSKRTPSSLDSNVMTLGITPESQVNSLLDHARSALGITQLAVIGSTEATQTFGEMVRLKAQSLSMSIVFQQSFAKEDIAAATAIGQSVGASAAQAILFLDNASVAGTVAAGIPEAQRKTLKLFGLAAWDSDAQLKQAGTVLDGARFVSGFAKSSAREAVRNFIATYQQRYREIPDVVAAQGFDAASLAIAAKTRQQTGGSIAATLQQLPPYEGLTGRIEWGIGHTVQRKLAVLEFRNGEIKEVL